MSWLFSQALVAAYSEDISSDGEPSVPLSGNPTQQAYCAPDRMTAFSRLSRFGMTFKPLTESLGQDVLTSYLAAFPAKTLAQPDEAQALTEPDPECGHTWQELLARYDPATSLWKTPQCSLLGDYTEFSETWPRWGSMQNGVSYQRQTLVHHTSETASGSWPTPRSCSAMAATITPESAWAENRFPNLETVVGRRLWPTPNAGNENWGGTMQEWGGSKNWVRKEMPEFASGQLNPTWVEWLMGWPLEWTDLKPLATDKFLLWQQQHSDF